MLARRTVVWRLAAAAGTRCRAHSSTRLSVDASLAVMGLSHGASPTEVKLRFYELAKLTHPDAVRDAPPTAGQPTFVEVLSAFEVLVAEEAAAAASAGATAPNAAARGGAGPARRTSRAAAARRKKTLSEVLCERLEEEPSAAMAVWTDLKQRELPLNEATMDLLFRACARSGGLPAAEAVMREAVGLLTPSVRAAALVSLIKWCKEDKSSFEKIMNLVDEAERTPEEMEYMSYANFLYSGVDGYSK
mmetsp:Transcript_45146/g.146842  ORF Transcript_45146/g.146842 Transcript_45146/m.146842 type:complete len:247 (-) Transcript_45146:30-770(-)